MSSAEKVCRKCGNTYPATVVYCPTDGAVLESTDGDPLVGTLIADRYRIISRIGEGGMGQVYLAEHVHMRRKCAVKFLNPDLAGNEAALKRFIREAENASRIDHPNVVTMYDFGETPTGTYLAMEFVDGESLRKRVEREGALHPEIVASIIRQIASALHAAHQLQIVHRDLKPDNIMLIARGDETRVKVVDFGIAKAKDPKQKVTVTGAIVGTPDYMSPEQVTGDEMDGRSDQYALALVAVKILTGKLPFANTTGVESLTSRLFTEPAALRSLRTDVQWPQQLQDVITRALSAKPDARFPSVMEFAKAFDRALSSVHGAVASTVPEITISDVIPPTRMSERREATPPAAPTAPARGSRQWLMVAGFAIVAVGGASYWMVTNNAAGPEVAPFNLPVAGSGASTTATADSQVTLQSRQALVQHDSAKVPAQLSTRAGTAPTGALSRPIVRDTAPRTGPPVRAATDTPNTKPAPKPAAIPLAPDAPKLAATPAPDSTPKKAAPSATPALNSDQVGAELTRVRPLMTPESPRADVERGVAALTTLLPKVGERSDSIRVLYTRARGQAQLEDLTGACRSLAGALAIAAGTRLQETIARTSRDLSCP